MGGGGGGGGGGSSENFLDETLFELLAKFDAYKSITRAKFNIHICGGEKLTDVYCTALFVTM